jgi:hypothetical protein
MVIFEIEENSGFKRFVKIINTVIINYSLPIITIEKCFWEVNNRGINDWKSARNFYT